MKSWKAIHSLHGSLKMQSILSNASGVPEIDRALTNQGHQLLVKALEITGLLASTWISLSPAHTLVLFHM